MPLSIVESIEAIKFHYDALDFTLSNLSTPASTLLQHFRL
jgi:hypothetical protein